MKRSYCRRPVSLVAHQPRQRTRRGSWLAQAVITITVMSVLMTLISTTLFRMYRHQTVMVERTFQTSTWLRLSRDFRQDVHAATSIIQSEDGRQLEVTTPDARVVWLADGEIVRRVVPTPETSDAVTSVNAVTLPGEAYVFADNTTRLVLTSGVSGAASVASVEVTPLPTPNGGTLPPDVTVATTGLDHRFANRDSTPEAQP
jgi:hypothetical protein